MHVWTFSKRRMFFDCQNLPTLFMVKLKWWKDLTNETSQPNFVDSFSFLIQMQAFMMLRNFLNSLTYIFFVDLVREVDGSSVDRKFHNFFSPKVLLLVKIFWLFSRLEQIQEFRLVYSYLSWDKKWAESKTLDRYESLWKTRKFFTFIVVKFFNWRPRNAVRADEKFLPKFEEFFKISWLEKYFFLLELNLFTENISQFSSSSSADEQLWKILNSWYDFRSCWLSVISESRCEESSHYYEDCKLWTTHITYRQHFEDSTQIQKLYKFPFCFSTWKKIIELKNLCCFLALAYTSSIILQVS